MTTLNVTGMNCGHCVMSVKKALSAVPNVESVEVDLETGKAVVKGQAATEALIAAVENAGFDAAVA